MATFSDGRKRDLAFGHALSHLLTTFDQRTYESVFKSAHTVRASEVWAEDVPAAIDRDTANLIAISGDVVSRLADFDLTEIDGADGEAYAIEIDGAIVRPWISPLDVIDSVTTLPSFGYRAILKQGDDTVITPSEGRWEIDYHAGMVLFENGHTPIDLGYVLPLKIDAFVYTGQFMDDAISGFALTGHVHGPEGIADDAITMPKIADSGAISGQAIVYDGEDWAPSFVPTVSPEPPPPHPGVVWIRSTDFVQFVYDGNRKKWLSTDTLKFEAARNRPFVTDQYIRTQDGAPTNVAPFVLPYDATFVGMAARSRDPATWTAEIHVGDALISGALLSFDSERIKIDNGFDIDFSEGAEIEIYMGGIGVAFPKIEAFFRQRS